MFSSNHNLYLLKNVLYKETSKKKKINNLCILPDRNKNNTAHSNFILSLPFLFVSTYSIIYYIVVLNTKNQHCEYLNLLFITCYFLPHLYITSTYP